MHFIEYFLFCLGGANDKNSKLVYSRYTICSGKRMKQIYFVLIFFIATLGYAQEKQPSDVIQGFQLYPNPVTNGKVNITTTLNAPKKVLIFDVLGTKVMETTILGSELNLSELDAGIYVLRVFEKDKVATRKLIIK